MGVLCDRLKLDSTAALNLPIGQNEGWYCKNELLFLLVTFGEFLLSEIMVKSGWLGKLELMKYFFLVTFRVWPSIYV